MNDPAHSGGTGQAAVAEAIAARDRSDTTRAVSPLIDRARRDVIDTTSMSIDDVVRRVMADGAGDR